MSARTYAVAAIVAVGLALILTLFGSIQYTNNVQRESDQRWCDLLVSLDQPTAPGTSDRAKKIQGQIHQLRIEFGCAGREAS